MPDCPAAAKPLLITPKILKLVVEATDFFDFDKATLKQDAITKLSKMAGLVNNSSQITSIRVLGYTDRIGTEEYNMKLSQRRAESVRDFLVSYDHIDTNKIEVVAMGKKNPRVTCEGVRGKQQLISCLEHNRRVEILLSFDKEQLDN